MPDRDRDQSVDHVLRRVLAARAQSPQSPCVDGETLAAWTSGALRPEQAADVERHVADCARCQAMMAVFVQTTPELPAAESIWRGWRLGWVVPLATAATAAALWFAVPPNPIVPSGVSETVTSTAAVERPSPPPASVPAPVEAERESLPRTRLQESVDARADNELRKQLKEAPKGERAEDRLAAAAPPAPPAAPAAAPAPAEAAEADRRETAANASPRAFAARDAFALPEVVAPGGMVRWRIVNGRQIERSTSAGSTWTAADFASPEILTAGAASSSSVCWIVGRRGVVYLTTDGVRFERLPFPETVDLVTVVAVDDRTANVSTADGRSWRTVDQGRTWVER